MTELVSNLVKPEQAQSTDVYICGSRKMTEDVESLLVAKGFPRTAIHHETFY